ncbi:MAG: tagaturonate reductase [Neolewinella sp.]|jgi:tagaturonate reductase
MLNPQDFDRPHRPLRILQFGGGNFLRAFVDWMIDVLNEQTDFNGGVVIVKPTSRGDYTELRAQKGLFTVALDGIRQGELIAERRVVTCVQEVIQPYLDRAAYLATAELPDLRFIISNTTEAGIRFREEPMPTEGMPTEFPAKLCLWLHHRFQHFGADGRGRGCIILPVELIENNGGELRDCILRYARHWGLSEAFQQWTLKETHFCNTLVDRIVSGYPADRAAAIAAETGHEDPLLVAGEYYHSWVIAGAPLAAEELPFSKTDLNVTFTNDLDAYREIKVRILNGAHTSIVPTGYLAGLETVGDVMADEKMNAFLEGVLYHEIIPSLDYPEAGLKAFAADVLDRFRNPSIHHKLMDISLNSTSKFRTRLLPSLLAYQAKRGTLPAGIIRAFAALIRFYRGEQNGESIALRDDAERIAFFKTEWARVLSGQQPLRQLTSNILAREDWWDIDLNFIPGLTDALTEALKNYQD